ncbi:Uma2 family endonuclease [Nonomuraea sp. NPDC050783]|uniref:Uma2 family endonuclease n=1 Tax=Nonomuraea sp. NPDC050783 TaxID=3154634 RepID=UPI0034657EE8
MATIEPTGTVADLLRFPGDGDRHELFNGSPVAVPAPTPRHQRVISRLLVILEAARPPELECLTTVNVSPSAEDLYIPDLVVVPEQVSEAVDLVYSPRDLLLAVEVVSPGSRTQDRSTKLAAYAEAGILRYWRIEPDEGPSLYVYELDGRSYEGPTVHKAGADVTLSAPFPVTFDPADLLRPRRQTP